MITVHGSFTGIRIGIALAKGIAESLNIPLITCTSLEALSLNAKAPIICSIIDARNNQVYAGIFDEKYKLLGNYMADDFNNILQAINKYEKIVFVGSGVSVHKNHLTNVALDNNIHAKNIGILGYNKYKSGLITYADDAVPLYLRPSQAERMKLKNGQC